MSVRSRLFRSGLGLLVVAFGGYATAAAQRPAPKVTHTTAPPKAKPEVKPTHPAAPRIPESFTGIASKLNTTPTALETAFEAAHTANPKLTHGEFIAANVIAKDLGAKNSAITVQAILDGLKSGKSIGKTLQGFGLSAKDADAAEDAAQKEIKTAEKAAREAAKPTPPEPKIPKSFDDLASKLGTTPAALETQFEAAHTADPKLTRREFLIADLVAQNLGATNKAVTLQALLDGAKGKGGRNLNKVLEGLGLTKKQADAATDAAEKEIKDAEKPVPPKKP
jgi:hypothetical protein